MNITTTKQIHKSTTSKPHTFRRTNKQKKKKKMRRVSERMHVYVWFNNPHMQQKNVYLFKTWIRWDKIKQGKAKQSTHATYSVCICVFYYSFSVPFTHVAIESSELIVLFMRWHKKEQSNRNKTVTTFDGDDNDDKHIKKHTFNNQLQFVQNTNIQYIFTFKLTMETSTFFFA